MAGLYMSFNFFSSHTNLLENNSEFLEWLFYWTEVFSNWRSNFFEILWFHSYGDQNHKQKYSYQHYFQIVNFLIDMKTNNEVPNTSLKPRCMCNVTSKYDLSLCVYSFFFLMQTLSYLVQHCSAWLKLCNKIKKDLNLWVGTRRVHNSLSRLVCIILKSLG